MSKKTRLSRPSFILIPDDPHQDLHGRWDIQPTFQPIHRARATTTATATVLLMRAAWAANQIRPTYYASSVTVLSQHELVLTNVVEKILNGGEDL